MVIPTKNKDVHSWAECLDKLIWGVKYMKIIHIVSVRGIVALAHMRRATATLDRTLVYGV